MRVTFSIHNDNPATIYNRLAAKLGRAPTAAEVKADVRRILEEATADLASKGALPRQRGDW